MAKNNSEKRPNEKRSASPADSATEANRGPKRKNPGRPTDKSPRPPQPQRQEKSTKRAQPLRSRPANENEPGTAALISRMRKRPSSAPLWLAFIASLVWVFAFFAQFFNQLGVLANPLAAENLPTVLTGTALLFLPIFLLFSTAYLLWRAQQMRHISEGLIHTAMRLIRPQEVAADGLMSFPNPYVMMSISLLAASSMP